MELSISNSFKEAPNFVSSKFYGKIKIEHAFTLFEYNRGGLSQNLLHRLKYEGYYDLGVWLGKLLGSHIMKEPWVKDIDLIVPIPLHRKKLAMRGYNQSESFARGISEIIDKPHKEPLIRQRNTATQTKKSRLERWKNVADIFQLSSVDNIGGKNILLVDDVITSGATLEAAAKVLQSHGANKIFVATIASA